MYYLFIFGAATTILLISSGLWVKYGDKRLPEHWPNYIQSIGNGVIRMIQVFLTMIIPFSLMIILLFAGFGLVYLFQHA